MNVNIGSSVGNGLLWQEPSALNAVREGGGRSSAHFEAPLPPINSAILREFMSQMHLPPRDLNLQPPPAKSPSGLPAGGRPVGKPAPAQTSLANRVTAPLGRAASAAGQTVIRVVSACAQAIRDQFPNMDATSRAAVDQMCDPAITEVTVTDAQATADGIGGMAAAVVQSPSLKTLKMDRIYCNSETFADQFGAALQNPNNTLTSFSMRVCDLKQTQFTPSPMTEAGAIKFANQMPCFSPNLQFFDMGPLSLTQPFADAFAAAVQIYSPRTIAFSWNFDGTSLDPQFFTVAQGLATSPCVTGFWPGFLEGLSLPMMASLFEAAKTSQTLGELGLWCVYPPRDLNSTIAQSIAEATAASTCLMNITNRATVGTCFPPDLQTNLTNSTQGKTPCPPPQCVPRTNCSVPAVPSASTTAAIVPAAASATAGGVLIFVIGAAVGWMAKNGKLPCRRPQRNPADEAQLEVQIPKPTDSASAVNRDRPAEGLPEEGAEGS